MYILVGFYEILNILKIPNPINDFLRILGIVNEFCGFLLSFNTKIKPRILNGFVELKFWDFKSCKNSWSFVKKKKQCHKKNILEVK